MELLNIVCPSCGAPVTHRINSRRVTCAYCAAQFILGGEGADSFVETAAETWEDEELRSLSMPKFAAQVCEEFLERTGQNDFKDTPKVREGLGIRDGDTVYLIHDDTMFKSGKNGFAITNRGVYCRGLYEAADFLDWDSFAKLEEPKKESGGYITCGSRKVGYYTGNNDVQSDLLTLYQRLHRHAGNP